MRQLLWAILVLGPTGPAYASPQLGTSQDLSGKGVGGEPAYDGREGGETIEDAIVIEALPFGDLGATCDNVDAERVNEFETLLFRI